MLHWYLSIMWILFLFKTLFMLRRRNYTEYDHSKNAVVKEIGENTCFSEMTSKICDCYH